MWSSHVPKPPPPVPAPPPPSCEPPSPPPPCDVVAVVDDAPEDDDDDVEDEDDEDENVVDEAEEDEDAGVPAPEPPPPVGSLGESSQPAAIDAAAKYSQKPRLARRLEVPSMVSWDAARAARVHPIRWPGTTGNANPSRQPRSATGKLPSPNPSAAKHGIRWSGAG